MHFEVREARLPMFNSNMFLTNLKHIHQISDIFHKHHSHVYASFSFPPLLDG